MTLTGINQVDEILNKLLRNDTAAADNKIDFNKRMETYFDKQNWLLKPASLSPAACSRFGWKCIDKEILSCVTCSSTLCVKLPRIWNSLAYDKCEKETIKSLQTAHRKHCPWSLAPSPESFVQMEPEHKGQAYKEFVNRLESLIQIKEVLPAIKNGVLVTMDLTDDMISSLCKLSRIPNDEVNRSALIMACTGWTKSPFEKKCIFCSNCHRTVSLWFFMPVESSPCNNSELFTAEINPVECASFCKKEECSQKEVSSVETASLCEKEESMPTEVNPADSLEKTEQEDLSRSNSSGDILHPAKRIRTNEPLQPFDPLYEHRHWCLWVAPGRSKEAAFSFDKGGEECKKKDDSDSSKGKPGWRIYLDCLLRNLDGACGQSPSPTKPTPEKLKKIRQMLESWAPDPLYRLCFEP